jgi:type II secretory pathway component PulF
MPLFSYKYLDKQGKKVKSKGFFTSPSELDRSIPEGCYLVDYSSIKIKSKKINRNDLISFTSQFSSLVNSGLNVEKSLETITQTKNSDDIKILSGDVLSGIVNGETLYQSFKNSSRVVPNYYTSAIQGGESSNNIPKTTVFLYNYILDLSEGKSKIVSALAYPAFIFIIAILASAYLLIEVVPVMQKSYSSINQDLPDITLNIIALSDFFKSYWIHSLSLIAFLVVSISTLYNSSYRKNVLSIIEKIPFIGSVLKNGDIFKFLTTCGLLVKQGIPITISMRISLDGMYFTNNYGKIEREIKNIEYGSSIHQSMYDCGLLNDSTIGIMKSGEVGNKVGVRMIDIADLMRRKQEKQLDILTNILGPFSIVLVGGLILFIALGMMMPMFNLNDINF